MIITDLEEPLNLLLDPPAVILRHCHAAVQCWRWKRIEKVCPSLAAAGSGRGPLMEPVWKALKAKVKDANWTQQHNGGSTICDGQPPVPASTYESVWVG